MAAAKGTRSKGSGKGTAGKAGQKKNTSARSRKPARRPEPVVSTAMLGLMVLGIGIFLMFCLIAPSSAIALVAVRGFINGVFGRMGWLFVLMVCWYGLQHTFGDRWPLRKSALAYTLGLLFCIATMMQVFQLDAVLRALKNEGYEQSYGGFLWMSYTWSTAIAKGGGFVGGLLGYPMGQFLEVLGSLLLLFFAIGGLLLALLRTFFPGIGGQVGGWWDSLKSDWAERRELRNEERDERQSNAALLVPIPAELLVPDPDDEAEPPKKTAKGKRIASPPQEPEPIPVRAPAPTKTSAPAKASSQVKAAAPARITVAPRVTPAQKPAGTVKRPALFIEDILPDAPKEPTEATPFSPTAEPGAGKGRPARKEPEAIPDFLAKRRAQYEADYGELSDRDNNAPYTEPEPEPEPVLTPVDDLPWEPVERVYTPATAEPPPTRRRRAQTQNPLDRVPVLAPETRLDRPDWKPPEPPKAVVAAEPDAPEYRQPPFSLLERNDARNRIDTRDVDAAGAQKLEETLGSFGVDARVIKVVHGPAITRYELQPAPGVRVNRIVSLTDDIALNMAAVGVRIEAPIPGKSAIGIEIANDEIETVHMREVLESDESLKHPSRLAVALGKDIAGKRIIADLARMPHLLIAGATGSGKSVCINTIITSIIYRSTPDEVRLILVDPKKVELSVYNGIPHLLVPVVTDPKKASGALNWAVMEMDERYRLFADVGVRDIRGYNAQRASDIPLMPQIVVIIDELSDLMLVAPGEVEESICRLAQLARACGIHLVIATQRPSVNVITGIIKANIPSRIAFAVSSQVDSRTILDGAGAEKLLGKGDMLYAPSGGGKPMRVQGCFVSDGEVARVTEYVKERTQVDYSQAVIDALSATDEQPDASDEDNNDSAGDALYQQAVEMAVESGQTSISMLQRRLRVGYARAGRLVDEMTRRGIISAAEGAKPREVLITQEDLRLLFKK